MAAIYCPNKSKINFTSQQHKMECWLACYQMMYSWKGKTDDIETELGKTLAAPPAPLSASDATTVADCKSKGLAGKYFFAAAGALGLGSIPMIPSSAASLQSYFTIFKSPLWVAGQWLNTTTNSTYKHVRIVTGADDSRDRVECIDPEQPQGAIGFEWEPWQWFYDGAKAYMGILGSIQYWPT